MNIIFLYETRFDTNDDVNNLLVALLNRMGIGFEETGWEYSFEAMVVNDFLAIKAGFYQPSRAFR